jgi:hypothetical protein
MFLCWLNMKQIDLYGDCLPEPDAALVARIHQEAIETPAREKGLAIHVRSIETLRAKGYTYRDIAGWFTERGIKVNHVDVWRAHKNDMDSHKFFATVDEDDEWKDYIDKKRDGETTHYGEVEFDAEGNKIEKNASGSAQVPRPPELSRDSTIRQKPRRPRKNR